MTLHAKLSASGSTRWMACPGSVRLEQDFPDTSSAFADEGTAAHFLGEQVLLAGDHAETYIGRTIVVWSHAESESEGTDWLETIEAKNEPLDSSHFEVTKEFADFVQVYVDFCRAHPAEVTFVEKRVCFARWVDEGFGTCDFGAIAARDVYVTDLKFGQGVKVDAYENPQLQLYALGFLDAIEDIFDEVDTFHLSIVQPRLDHVSTWTVSKAELLAFGEEAKKHADLALQDNAPLVPGEKQCTFCKARRHCTARAEYNLRNACNDFAVDFRLRNADTFDCNGLGELLPYMDELIKWAGEMKERALTEALHGNPVPGFKLVEGRSVRTWTDPAAVANAMLAEGKTAQEIYNTKLIGIGDAEKLMGKKHEIFARFTDKPEGKPTLVPASDPRAELKKTAAQDFEAA